MAILDNFVVQIMNDSDLIGYILIYSGEDSCRDEAQARALRMKKYMANVRGVPLNRVMWKHGGRFKGKGLEIFHLGVERKGLASFDFPYEPPAPGQIIRACRNFKKPLRLERR